MATLNNPGPAVGDQFGYSVAISGTRVVIGASGDDTGATDAGSAYVYDLSSGMPTVPVATLNNPGPAVGDQFGYSVAISGTRVVVGALSDDTGATNAGSAYVYDLSNGTPNVPVAMLNNPGPAVGDQFGYSVTISGTRVVIGASGDDSRAGDAGSAYVFDLSSGTPTVPVATLNNPGRAPYDYFGNSVAIDGTTVAIGTPGEDTGHAYIFGIPRDEDSDGLLDSWELTYWPTTTGHGPADDSDHDGYNELLELALGLNPTVPDSGGLPPVTIESGVPPVTGGGNYLTMTITKRPGVTYEVQSASSLFPGLADSFSTVSTTVLVNDATTLKARDNIPLGGAVSRFLRLKVTAAL